MKKQSNPEPSFPKPPPPPAPPPKRIFKEIFFVGIIETEGTKQRTRDWNNSLARGTEK